MNYPIIDLHSDLLSYLQEGKGRTPYDPASRGSFSQLKAGGVKLQALALFSHFRPGCTQIVREQLKLLKALTIQYPTECALYHPTMPSPNIQLIPAFEGGAGFSEESEPIAQSLARLEQIQEEFSHILYIGMTWDGENRFGGGVGFDCGLKEDGKRLLDWMAGKNIAIDFSHTSDSLAEGILTYIDQETLSIPVLASHSNFRAITDLPRNMPDWLAQELIRRKGVMGINLFAPFIRKNDPNALFRHIEYGLSLGAHDALAFGADFFCEADFPSLKKYQTDTAFFPEYPDAGCYGSILNQCASRLNLSEEQLHKIAHRNAERFFAGCFSTLSI
jgi:microsomal dipeptidase-like Zn-dependent dipeptidase